MSPQELHVPAELIELLIQKPRAAVLTGAGISAESGVPTFREAQTGLWARYNPGQLATPAAFNRDPKLVWDWYKWRRQLISQAQPNAGHFALVRFENYFSQFTLITQNVDGLHRLAGSKNIIELHGDISRTRCSIEGIEITDRSENGEIPPRCPNCGGFLRPDVVWFGESLPEKQLQAALQSASSCQVFFSIGTSTLVEPAASLPFLALRNGAKVIEVNIDQTPLTPSAEWHFAVPASKFLEELAQTLEKT